MIPKDGLDLQYCLAALKRRLWYVVIPFFLVMTATVIYCIITPKIYQSSSLILVQIQGVSKEYVKPSVTSDVQVRLSAITDEIMSRSKLEEIIENYDLYSEARAAGTIHDAVEIMRKHIVVTPKISGRDYRAKLTSFEVSFQGKEPTKVRDVTAALTDLFIHYNSRLRQEQTAGTSKFLEGELDKMKGELRRWEDKVRRFKEKYAGLLPEQMENNYRILAQLQQHLDSINTTLQKIQDRKILVQTQQLSQLDNLSGDILSAGSRGGKPLTLAELRYQLQALQSRYSNQHPDVIKLRTRIAKLESEKQISTARSGSRRSSDAQEPERFEQEGSSSEVELIDKELISLRKEKKQTKAQIKKYHHRIEKGPRIEAMFLDLRRGYEQANTNYQSLLQKKQQAEMAENLERTQIGEQFKILDPANMPSKPIKPDIQKLLALGLMLALASGFGLAYLGEYLDPTFWSRKEVESMLELPVLVSVPVIQTDKERHRARLKLVRTVGVLVIMSSALLIALLVLWKKSPGLLPL